MNRMNHVMKSLIWSAVILILIAFGSALVSKARADDQYAPSPAMHTCEEVVFTDFAFAMENVTGALCLTSVRPSVAYLQNQLMEQFEVVIIGYAEWDGGVDLLTEQGGFDVYVRLLYR